MLKKSFNKDLKLTKKILNFSEICVRYAKALISLHGDDKNIKKASEELGSIVELKNTCKDFENFLANPILAPEKKIIILKKINKKIKLSISTLNFLCVLSKHNRLFAVERIHHVLKDLIGKKNNESRLELITVTKVDNKLEKKIGDKISELVNKKIKIDNIIDENIIGGMIIKIDSLMIDCSISSKLSELGNLEKGSY